VVITATMTGTALAAPADPEKQATAGQAAGNDTTSPIEKKRVDSVPTPKLGWYTCYRTAECATVRLPLDYDQPKGATTEIAVLRVKARNQQKKIGTLFVNPGGPGGQGTEMAYFAPQFLGDDVLDHFDVVGFDPRGIGFSDNIKCFKSTKDQTQAMAGMDTGFPYTKAEETAFITSAKALGGACSSTGKSLAGAMSTAEVARDMDVLRRAVGDKKLSYLGFSYGTALGQYYANMFPDRVRAVVVDGVIDPVTWVGTDDTARQILDDRLLSADGAYKALHEILVRCGKAGTAYCTFAAGGGDPVQKFEVLAQRLRDKPAVISDGGDTATITYADFIGGILGALYNPAGYSAVDAMSTELYDLTSPAGSVPSAKLDEAKRALIKRIRDERARVSGWDFPYDSSLEGFSGVTCTDGRHPKDPNSWPAATANADKRAPYFGRAWGWSTVQCASSSWTVRDEDAYLGPFNRRTSAPVLFVGDFWDPATNYSQAVSSNKLLPNSGLVSSDSWGHTAYGTSKCVTGAVDRYLVEGVLPATVTPCVGDDQPFTKPLDSPPPPATRSQPNMRALSAGATSAVSGKVLPPVAMRMPPSVLLGTR
jgi:pimeloyl-ACP methyl ester carboxylesterase